MFCCIYRGVSNGDFIYGILDTNDNVVENHTEASLVPLIQRGISISGLSVSNGELKYHSDVYHKFEPDEVVIQDGIAVVTGVRQKGYKYEGFALIFKDATPGDVTLVDGFKSEHYMYTNWYIPPSKPFIRISFNYTDKHYYGEDRSEDFVKYLDVNFKTGNYRVSPDWQKCIR